MSHTEIPTNLLVHMHDVIINKIKYQYDNRNGWDVGPHAEVTDTATVEFTTDDIEELKPLIKWLEYFDAACYADYLHDHEPTR